VEVDGTGGTKTQDGQPHGMMGTSFRYLSKRGSGNRGSATEGGRQGRLHGAGSAKKIDRAAGAARALYAERSTAGNAFTQPQGRDNGRSSGLFSNRLLDRKEPKGQTPPSGEDQGEKKKTLRPPLKGHGEIFGGDPGKTRKPTRKPGCRWGKPALPAHRLEKGRAGKGPRRERPV